MIKREGTQSRLGVSDIWLTLPICAALICRRLDGILAQNKKGRITPTPATCVLSWLQSGSDWHGSLHDLRSQVSFPRSGTSGLNVDVLLLLSDLSVG